MLKKIAKLGFLASVLGALLIFNIQLSQEKTTGDLQLKNLTALANATGGEGDGGGTCFYDTTPCSWGSTQFCTIRLRCETCNQIYVEPGSDGASGTC